MGTRRRSGWTRLLATVVAAGAVGCSIAANQNFAFTTDAVVLSIPASGQSSP